MYTFDEESMIGRVCINMTGNTGDTIDITISGGWHAL